MKYLILTGLCLICTFGYSQNWSKEQIALIDKYGLEKTDHRGLVLSTNAFDCQKISSIEEAIINFFTSDIRKDITTLCISSDSENITGTTLNLFEITTLYLKITEQKSK